jgi:hypothetical protein
MENSQYTKWVACWGNAMSYTDRKEATYAKDLTLRYPLRMCFNGSALRFHFSNLTGTEPVTIKSCFAAKNKEEYEPVGITFDGGKDFVTIMPQQEVCSDEIKLNIKKGEIIDVSFYLENFTQLTSGVLITGPLSGGKFSYGNHTLKKDLPVNLTRKTDWYYFL